MIKKTVSILLSFLLLFSFVNIAFADGENNEIANGTLTVLAYNVSGIPLVGDFQGTVFTLTNKRAALIGELLNKTEVDFIAVEEDFNGHEYLAEKMTAYPYRSYTSGGLAQGQGLNVFSVHKLYNIDRVKWRSEFGNLSGSTDALSNKGFVYSLMEIDDGIYIDMITVHMDAGYDPLSVLCRTDNFKQLAEYISDNLTSGRPLIVTGDFNYKFKRQLNDDIYNNLLVPTGLKDVWSEVYNNGLYTANDPSWTDDSAGDDLDRTLFRSGDNIRLIPISRVVPDLLGENGERYTDHNPMLCTFEYSVTEKENTPDTLNEPVPEDQFLLGIKEFLYSVVRFFQLILGFLELPYLIGQGIELLVNGKMP